MGRIFGTDGVRGIANTELNCTLAMDIARAAAMVVAEKRNTLHPLFVIGSDTRISKDVLVSAITAGLCSVGADVLQVGVVPTPAVAYLVGRMQADAAIMLSASHNPFEYNGIKIFGADGYKLTDEEEFEIEDIVLDHVLPYDLRWSNGVGIIYQDFKAVERYIQHIVSTVEGDLSGLRVAVDCANGSASRTAEEIFRRLKADVTLFHNDPDGMNINDNCGSTHMDQLGELVVQGGFDLGVAFDGDADRCLAVDHRGQLVDGDRILALCALYQKERGQLENNAAVVTILSNLGFFQFAQEHGIQVERTKVGDRYVLERMREKGYGLGGEQSGHIIFRQHMTTGDGQLTAVQLMQVLKHTGKSLEEAASVMTVYPQVAVNVRADREMKKKAAVDEGVQKAIDSFQRQLGEGGRILVRPSGTEPVIRVMVEGADLEEIQSMAQEMAQIITERLAY